MQDLQLTIIQCDIHWEDIDANLDLFQDKINTAGPTDVIVLPEMFTTGFTNNTALAEMMGMRTFQWMKKMAEQTGALIIGGFMAHVHDKFYNRVLWMEPAGQYKTYDKRHLFSLAGENKIFSRGESLLIGTWKGWRICPLVCYDLRFPVWSRNCYNAVTQKLDFDLLVYLANWPQVRIQSWEVLLKARAIENMCYVAGVNRIGIDGNGIEYNGHSEVAGPRGDQVFSVEGIEEAKTITLSANALQSFREKFPAYLDADAFTIDEVEGE